MRYPDGGGLIPAARVRREQVRLEAAGLFAAGVRPPQVARQLRVSCKSAYAWHKAWSPGGHRGVAVEGAGWAELPAQRRAHAAAGSRAGRWSRRMRVE